MKYIIIFFSLLISGCWAGNGRYTFYERMVADDKLIEWEYVDEKNNIIRKDVPTWELLDEKNRITRKNTPIDKGMIVMKEDLKTEKCVYGLILGILPPLNFWDVRFTDKQDIKYAIKKLQKQDPKIKGLSDIGISYTYVSFPIFGWGCTRVSGHPIYDNTK